MQKKTIYLLFLISLFMITLCVVLYAKSNLKSSSVNEIGRYQIAHSNYSQYYSEAWVLDTKEGKIYYVGTTQRNKIEIEAEGSIEGGIVSPKWK